MKELSIEEKAQRYDEAIERAKGVIEQNPLMEYLKKGIEYILPELKESEDEKMIRIIEDVICTNEAQELVKTKYGLDLTDLADWLEKQGKKELVTCPICGSKFEKQGEQNPQIKLVFPKFRVGDIIQHIPLEKWDTTKKIVHIDETGYYFNLSHQGDTVSGGFIGFSLENDYELVKQNPAMIQWKGDNLKEVIDFTGVYKEGFEKWFHNSWEEYEKYVHEHNNIFKIFNEDGSHMEVPVGAWIIKAPDGYNTASRFAISPILTEISIESNFKFKKAIECIENYVNSFPHSQRPEIWQHINFLKSLKPQPKQEWSEEDKKKRLAIIAHLDIQASNYCINRERYSNGYKLDALIDWLKSLRPQSTWNRVWHN